MDQFLDSKQFLSFSSVFEPSERRIEEAKRNFSFLEVRKRVTQGWSVASTVHEPMPALDMSCKILPDGTKHGRYTAFHRNSGGIAVECYFKNGLLEGKYEARRRNGTLMVEADFVGGKLHGYCTVWNAPNEFSMRYSVRNGKVFETESRWGNTICSSSENEYSVFRRNYNQNLGIELRTFQHGKLEDILESEHISLPFLSLSVVVALDNSIKRIIEYYDGETREYMV